MTEDEAKRWLIAQGISDRQQAQLEQFVDLVRFEATRQNLIAHSTIDTIWARHVVDSAQLVTGFHDSAGSWLDLGTGAGFPGIVIAVLREHPITLVESRRLRADFLTNVAATLKLANVDVIQRDVARVKLDQPARFITARAFAPLDRTFELAEHLTDAATQWRLSKGRTYRDELHVAKQRWSGMFHVEHSVTNADSVIINATDVRRIQQGGSG